MRLNRSGSLFLPPKISDQVIEKNIKIFKPDSSKFLKERGNLRHMIQKNQIDEARIYL